MAYVSTPLEGLPGEVRFSVHNHGPTIEPSMLAQIFMPLKRGSMLAPLEQLKAFYIPGYSVHDLGTFSDPVHDLGTR